MYTLVASFSLDRPLRSPRALSELSHSCQRRLEPVVILRNDHMTISHCAIYVMQLSHTQGMLINDVCTVAEYGVCVVDKDRTQYS